MPLETLGSRLRFARTAKHYLLSVVCRQLSIKPHTMRSYENGTRSVAYDLVRLLAYLYEADIDWLVNGEGEPPTVIPFLTPAEELMGFKTRPSKTGEARLKARHWAKPHMKDLPKVRASQT